MALLLSVLEQGMIYGILALGVYITYKILDFPDLTVDGSFPFGLPSLCVRSTASAYRRSSLFPLRSSAEHWWESVPD